MIIEKKVICGSDLISKNPEKILIVVTMTNEGGVFSIYVTGKTFHLVCGTKLQPE